MPYFSEHTGKQIDDILEAIQAVTDIMYPVGSIYMSVNSANPSSSFGGTWAAWGAGRVPVGVDVAQTEFDTVEETGGNKNLQSHTHVAGYTDAGWTTNTLSGGTQGNLINVNPGTAGNLAAPTTSAGTGNSGNLQPYITCYMWKRTA